VWVQSGIFWQWRQEAGDDFQPEILFIAVAVGGALDNSDFVVQALDHAEADFVFRATVRGDAAPVVFDHLCKFLIGFEPLPAQALFPKIKEYSSTALGAIAPQLAC